MTAVLYEIRKKKIAELTTSKVSMVMPVGHHGNHISVT